MGLIAPNFPLRWLKKAPSSPAAMAVTVRKGKFHTNSMWRLSLVW